MNISTVVAIVLAAGKSRRMGGEENKVLRPLRNRSVLSYSLEQFQLHPAVSHVVIVGKRDEITAIQTIVARFCPKAERHFVEGGFERFDSVRNGLEYSSSLQPDAVIIHDSARPFLQERFITNSLRCLAQYKGCVVGIPLFDTLKETQENAEAIKTHPRSKFWLAQTPQTFRFHDILNAYRGVHPPPYPTDDGEVLELAGEKVLLVEGSRYNIKLTTPEDWLLAEAILQMNENHPTIIDE